MNIKNEMRKRIDKKISAGKAARHVAVKMIRGGCKTEEIIKSVSTLGCSHDVASRLVENMIDHK